MKTKKNIYSFVMMLMAAMIAVSCSDKDLYDATANGAQKKSEFANNFVKQYGEIAPNQSWDFSSDTHAYSLSLPQAANARKHITRAKDNSYISDQQHPWYNVQPQTLNWMKETLTENVNHKDLGNPFYLVVPEDVFIKNNVEDNFFYIVPIYEGHAEFDWTLHIVVEDYDGNGTSLDLPVWKKHQDLEKKTNIDNNGWHQVTDNTLDATEVRALPVKIDFPSSFAGKKMYLYLENTYNGQPRNPSSSLDFKMLALDIPAEGMPTNLGEGFNTMIIGCEDQAIDANSDNDFNDVVFLIYGAPEIPKVRLVEEPIYDMVSKRYMVEDLGSTNDFDFNDVVVDVYDIVSKMAVYAVNEAGKKTFVEWKNETHSQQAIVRALGGTLDITVKIGSTTWTKSASQYPAGSMVNTGVGGPIDYNAELAKFPIKNNDWDRNANNISVEVGDQTSGDVVSITFPKAGVAPMILGFDVDESRHWMFERQSIPSTWFTEVN